MVAGGPYGLEDILGKAGYLRALLMLAIIPFLWSLPTALMVGELASAIPSEGGFYIWVRRALGPFWGFQEAWLSLAASVFDMALYPVIFVDYLGRVEPSWTAGHRGPLWALAVVAACALWNLRGAKVVGESSIALFCVLIAPFVILIAIALWKWHGHGTGSLMQPIAAPDIAGAISVTLWNYMGWDNASTVAQEVENPQRSYPRAMIAATFLVAVTYILPLAAMALSGLSPLSFSTGDWTTAARSLGGPLLGLGIVAGGAISGIGMFNALVMSYSRLPMAMAEERMLPLIVARRNSRGVPWVSVLLCGLAWGLALKLPFERLISIDLILYGSSLILEFIALAVLRIREPNLPRPFKAGNLAFAILLGVGPTVLIAYALYASRDEKLTGNISALLFSVVVALLGPVLYWTTAHPLANRRMSKPSAAD